MSNNSSVSIWIFSKPTELNWIEDFSYDLFDPFFILQYRQQVNHSYCKQENQENSLLLTFNRQQLLLSMTGM